MDWRAGGEQWAARWGGTTSQWRKMILPRIAAYLPSVRNAIELGGGMGRLSRHLARHCEQLWITEISERCHEGLQKFSCNSPQIRPLLTDGICLDPVPERSVDLAFSVFSLVHADLAMLEAILHQIKSRLRPDAVVFLHHSNAGTLTGGDPDVDRKLGRYRAVSVSAETFRSAAQRAGLTCTRQEVFGWDRDTLPTDCFSTLTMPGSRWEQPIEINYNRRFCAEAVADRTGLSNDPLST